MATVKVSSATGGVLNWMVAKAVGFQFAYDYPFVFLCDDVKDPRTVKHDLWNYKPSEDRAMGWQILDETPGFSFQHRLSKPPESKFQARIDNLNGHWWACGPTALVAGFRCWVASRLGDEVEVPDGVLKHYRQPLQAAEDDLSDAPVTAETPRI